MASVSKYSLVVEDTAANKSRLLWSIPLRGYIYSINEATGSDLAVVFTSYGTMAFQISSGSLVWNSSMIIAQVACGFVNGTIAVAAGYVESMSARLIVAFSLATGQQLYQYGSYDSDVEDYGAVFFAGASSLFIGSSESAVFVPYLLSPTLAPELPFPAAQPGEATSAPGYKYTTPQPQASVITTGDTAAVAVGAAMWRTSATQSYQFYSYTFHATDQSKRPLVVSITNDRTFSYLLVLNATDGTTVYQRTLTTTEGCSPSWMGQLSERYGAYYCPSTLSLSVFDTKDPLFAVTTSVNITGPPTELYLYGLNKFSPGIAQIPSLNEACLNIMPSTSEERELVCFDYITGSVIFSKVLCGSGTVPTDPYYDAARNQMYVGCILGQGSLTGGTTVAIRPDGTIAWQNAILKNYMIGNVYTADFGLSTVSSGNTNISIQLFNLSSGATVGVPYSLGNANQFYHGQMSLLQHSFQDPVAFAVVSTTYAVMAIQVPQRTLVWSYNGTQPLQENPTFGAVTIAYNRRNGQYYAMFQQTDYDNATFYIAELYTGGIVNTFTLPTGAATAVGSILSGNFVLFASSYNLVVIDVMGLGPYFQYPVRTLFMQPLALADPSVDTSIVVCSPYGTYERIFINQPTFGFREYSSFSFLQNSPILDVASAVLVSNYYDSYLYNLDTSSTNAGSMVWGVSFRAEQGSWSNYPSFPPQVFWNTAPMGTHVAVLSLSSRHFALIEMNSGLQLVDKFLPMCNGYSGNSFSDYVGFGTAQDTDNSVLYVTMENQCLYGIRAGSGDVFLQQNAKSGTIVGNPIVTPSCVVALDLFGTVSCFPRLAGPNGVPKPVVWSYATGYAFDHVNDQMQQFGEYLLVAVGPQLVCLSVNQSGQLFWTFQLGGSIQFAAFNGFVFAVSSYSIVKISMDPSVTLNQRIVWQVPHAVLGLGANVDYVTYRAQPLVTSSGIFVFASQNNMFGINVTSGALAYNISLGARTVQLASFTDPSTANDTVLSNIIFSASDRIRLHDANTGVPIIVYGTFEIPSELDRFPLKLNGMSSAIGYYTSQSNVMVATLPKDLIASKLAQPLPGSVPSVPPPNATLPAGFTPQGVFPGVPTVPPGVKLPDFGCVLNVEALYMDLVQCVNSAITVVYIQNADWNAVQCGLAAGVLNSCVLSWVGGTDVSCLGATLYLNQVLGQLNKSDAFNFCQQPQRCADQGGAQAVCDVMNTAARLAPGQTLYPAFAFPAPADQLPVFTQPATDQPAPATSASPAVTAVPATPLPSLAPGSTHAPSTASPPTTTSQPLTAQPNTPAPSAVPGTTPVIGLFQYLCSVVPGSQVPPKGFAVDVQDLLGLPTAPAINYIVVPAASEQDDPQSVKGAASSSSFIFYFADSTQALVLCTSLNRLLDTSPGLVATTLHVISIDKQPFQPAAPPQGDDGPNGSTAGVVVGSLGAVALVAIAGFFLYRKRSRGSLAREDDLLESGRIVSPKGPGGLQRDSMVNRGEEMAPILPAREAEGRGGYTQL